MDAKKVLKALDARKAIKPVTISFRIPPDNFEKLKKFCDKHNYTVTEILNQFVESFLKDVGEK